MKQLVVAGIDRHRVPQERPGAAVGGAEVAEQVVAVGEERLEDVEPALHPVAPPGDVLAVALAALDRGGDQVRLALPGPVEPVEEDLDLGGPGTVGGEQRRFGEAVLEVMQDARGVGDDVVAIDEHRDELLAAHRAQRGAVGRVERDRLHLDALVREGERDALDVGGVGDAVEAEHVAVERDGRASGAPVGSL